MNFEEKYLKYKAKYIQLKNEYDLSQGDSFKEKDIQLKNEYDLSQGGRSLFIAMDTCDLKLIEEKLLEKDNISNQKDPISGNTPLEYLIIKLSKCINIVSIFNLLLKYGANPKKSDAIFNLVLLLINSDTKSFYEVLIPMIKQLIDLNVHIDYKNITTKERENEYMEKLNNIYKYFNNNKKFSYKYSKYILQEIINIEKRNIIDLSIMRTKNDKNNLLEKLNELKNKQEELFELGVRDVKCIDKTLKYIDMVQSYEPRH